MYVIFGFRFLRIYIKFFSLKNVKGDWIFLRKTQKF